VCGNIQFGNGTQRIQKEAEKVKNKESAFTWIGHEVFQMWTKRNLL
jgi:hypothetical protein